MDIGVAHVDAVEHLDGRLKTARALAHVGVQPQRQVELAVAQHVHGMQGIMDAPLLKSSFRPGTLKLHVMNVCTSSANVNSWMRGRLLYEL